MNRIDRTGHARTAVVTIEWKHCLDDATQLIRIGERLVGGRNPCFVVAEVGVNHNGDLGLARELIDASAEAGADAVKFQSFRVEDLILPDVGKAPYQRRSSVATETQTAMLERLAVDEGFHVLMMEMCAERRVTYLSTPYDVASLDFLVDKEVAAVKIASTDANNLWFLEKVAAKQVPVLLSTGMTTLAEIEESYRTLREGGCDQIVLLQCTSAYPTEATDVHLRAMTTLATRFQVPVGFSDHTASIGASPYAVARGACLIEKHVTIDRSMEGPDHAASIEPNELAALIDEIRRVEQFLGSPNVGLTDSEEETRRALQRSIVACRSLQPGDTLSSDAVAMRRTGGSGIRAASWNEVHGRQVVKVLQAGDVIEWHHLGKLP